MGSAAFGVVAPGKRRFAADANTDEVGEDEDEDSEKSPDFLDVLSVKRAFLACAASAGNGSGASHARVPRKGDRGGLEIERWASVCCF